MRIALGCDHAGFPLKQSVAGALEADGHHVLDLGTFSTDPVDYPDFARAVGNAVLRGFVEAGVLICGSGVGASIAANKIRGVRAALCHDLTTARQSREDNDANVLCLGARVLDEARAVAITRSWVSTSFSGAERHARRLAKIEQLETDAGPERKPGAAPAPAPAPAAVPSAPPPPPTLTPRPAPRQAQLAGQPAAHGTAAAGGAAAPGPGRGAGTATAQPPAPASPRPAPPPAPRAVPPPPPPPGPAEPPRPRPVDPLAAAAAELIRQYTGGVEEEEAPPARREGVLSLDEEIEIITPDRERRPAGRPGPAPRPAAPPRPQVPEVPKATPEPARRPVEATAGPAESRPTPVEPPPPPPRQFRNVFALPPVEEALRQLDGDDFVERLWMKDAALWPGDASEVRNRLGWLTSPAIMRQQAEEVRGFASEAARLNFTHTVLLGMGGSSLAAEVFNLAFGAKMGYPDLYMLDSTDPGAVRRILNRVNLQRSLFLVSTKSGTTVETLSLYHLFRGQVDATRPSRPGSQFVAITDPGTPLEQLAQESGFRRTFLNPPTIGGRYSVLSYFGLVPAALLGLDVRGLLQRALQMVEACGNEVPTADHPGARLGALLAGLARSGRDKVTFVFSERLASFGAWVEQLLAESLGKDGKGLVPVDAEPLGPPEVYGPDRVFVALLLEGDTTHDQALGRLDDAGHPVLRLPLRDPLDLGAEFFRWEVATAAAGVVLGVNPFDEPNVASAKAETQKVLEQWRKSRRLPEWPAVVQEEGLILLAQGDSRSGSVAEGLAAHLGQARPGDYVALQAYLTPGPEAWSRLQEARVLLRDRLQLATTLAWGPRYLHSTGQLHKGGPNTGLFIQLTGDDAEDLPIPGAPYGLATLKAAQALGDLEALRAAGRRVVRLHLGGKQAQALERLAPLVRAATRTS